MNQRIRVRWINESTMNNWSMYDELIDQCRRMYDELIECTLNWTMNQSDTDRCRWMQGELISVNEWMNVRWMQSELISVRWITDHCTMVDESKNQSTMNQWKYDESMKVATMNNWSMYDELIDQCRQMYDELIECTLKWTMNQSDTDHCRWMYDHCRLMHDRCRWMQGMWTDQC